MSNRALNIPGTLKAKFLYLTNKGIFEYKGQSSSSNVSGNLKKLINNAELDARAKLLYDFKQVNNNIGTDRINSSSFIKEVNLLNYEFDYSVVNNFFTIKRINRNGKYYTYVFNKKTGKIVTIKRWSSKKDEI